MIWLVNIPYIIIIIFSWGSFLEDSSKINNSDDNTSRTLVFGPNDYFYTDDSLEQWPN